MVGRSKYPINIQRMVEISNINLDLSSQNVDIDGIHSTNMISGNVQRWCVFRNCQTMDTENKSVISGVNHVWILFDQ